MFVPLLLTHKKIKPWWPSWWPWLTISQIKKLFLGQAFTEIFRFFPSNSTVPLCLFCFLYLLQVQAGTGREQSTTFCPSPPPSHMKISNIYTYLFIHMISSCSKQNLLQRQRVFWVHEGMMYSKISTESKLKAVREEVGKSINGTGNLCPCRQGLPLPGKWIAAPDRSQILSSTAGTIWSLIFKKHSFLVFFFFFPFLCPDNSTLFNPANLGFSFVAIKDFLWPDKVLYLSTNKLTHCIVCLEKSVINKKVFKQTKCSTLGFNFLLDFISVLFFFKISFKGL